MDEIDDEDGFDDSDEYWRMNPKLGTYTAGPQKYRLPVPFLVRRVAFHPI